MEATFWALVPPILAIIISLLTKEVNLSLIVGIIVGCGLFCSFNPFTTVTTMFDIMSNKVYGNMGVLIFIIILGMIVHLMNMSGATHEYAKWASRKLKTRQQTLLATMALGIIIFVDDYFNCLTVGILWAADALNSLPRKNLGTALQKNSLKHSLTLFAQPKRLRKPQFWLNLTLQPKLWLWTIQVLTHK